MFISNEPAQVIKRIVKKFQIEYRYNKKTMKLYTLNYKQIRFVFASINENMNQLCHVP